MNIKVKSILFRAGFLAASLSVTQCNKSDNPKVLAITSVSPTSGVIGTTITITGTDFSPTVTKNLVTFGGISASVLTATSTQITATVPSGAKKGKISVSVSNQTASSADDFTLNPATITSISPTSGPFGTQVTLTGTGFDPVGANDSVFFNGKAATVVSATSTQVVVTVNPYSSPGPVTLKMDETMTTGPSFTYLFTYVVSAFTGSGTIGNSNGVGAAASFYDPTNVAMDSAGNVFVADERNSLIRKIAPNGTVTTLGASATFNDPVAVAVDKSGNVIVSDQFDQLIRNISSNGAVSTVAGTGSAGDTNGAALSATFNNPHGVAVDNAGTIFVADDSNDLIRKITTDGTVSTFAGMSGVPGAADGVGTAATFTNATAIAVDHFGNLYVADTGGNRIRKITPDGTVTTIAGNNTVGSSDGAGTLASFNAPTGIAVDYHGNLYVADFFNYTIRKITPNGVVSTIAGTAGVNGSVNGNGTSTKFDHPYSVCVNAAGNLFYIADSGNNNVRKMVLE